MPQQKQQNFWWTAVTQSSANQVLLVLFSSYARPFEAKSLQFGTFVLAATKQLLDQYRKLDGKKKQYNQ